MLISDPNSTFVITCGLVYLLLDTTISADEDIFIPCPFTIQEIPPVPYSGSDPEWREFIKIARDKELLANIRRMSTIGVWAVVRALTAV